MKHGSLFSGIGGFDLAASWMGWDNVFHCEIDKFCQKVLNYYWPNAISYEDIKNLSIQKLWEEYVLSVKNQYALQIGHIANNAIISECNLGETITEIGQRKTPVNGTDERRLKSSIITEESVFVAENLKWNFSQSTIRTIMAMKSGENINLKHGNLLLNVDSLMTTKSSVTTAIMQKLILDFVHIIQKNETDIITAGFPCQPASMAGKRKGTADHRWLWPETIRVIKEFQPTYAVFENVFGLTSLLESACESEMEAKAVQLFSEGDNSEEVEERIREVKQRTISIIINDLYEAGYTLPENEKGEPIILCVPACAVNAPHRRDRIWFVANRNTEQREWKERGFQSKFKNGSNGDAAYTERNGSEEKLLNESGETQFRGCNKPITTNTDSSKRLKGGLYTEGQIQAERHIGSCDTWSNRGNWQDFPTFSPICTRDDGFPGQLANISFPRWRNESIKGLGNAVVPQLVYEIFKAIENNTLVLK